jgi:molybdopterin-guanine dinucleotide biosynthesis protein A
MGADKSFLDVGGRPLVMRVRDALQASGASTVVAVGGDLERLRELGLDARPDAHPGEGPLGGLLTAFASITADLAFVTACDHPALDARLPGLLVDRWARTGASLAVVPVVDDHRQVLAALYHRRCVTPFAARFAAGQRSLLGALDHLPATDVLDVGDLPADWFADLDTPADLDHYAFRHGRTGG